MTRTRRLLAALVLAAAVAGCGTEDQSTPAAAESSTPAMPTAAATSSTPSPTVSASPTVDPDRPLAMGKSYLAGDGWATATVYGYRHNVARTAPRPDEQPGYVWGAADVKVCASKTNPESISVSNSPWSLVYADDTQIEPSSTGYQQFPEPEYPWGDKMLSPGRCVRGWITFPVPGKKHPAFVEYGPESETVPPRWVVK